MPRNKINVLYYPDMYMNETTLKKAILFFDEIHLMDQPAFTLNNYGIIGADSPFRKIEESFRENGVPLFVHGVQGGIIRGNLLEQVYADINDPVFLEKFRSGLDKSMTFRSIQITAGNYGDAGNQDEVVQKLISTNLRLLEERSVEDILSDEKIKPFELSTPFGCLKQLILSSAMCSAKLNFALIEGIKYDFIPLADAIPYSHLLDTKFQRAINKLDNKIDRLNISDLSFAIFDELISNEVMEKISVVDIVEYRKISTQARENFLEYLSSIQYKINHEINSEQAIKKLMETEIIPAVRKFKNQLETINDSFIANLAKGVIGYIGASGGVNIFTDLSWEKIAILAVPTSAYVIGTAIDSIKSHRAATRECSLSYLLSLDKLA